MIDYSSLSNEQVLELLQGLMKESIHRNMVSEAREILLTEKEKQEIKESAAHRAKEKSRLMEIQEIERSEMARAAAKIAEEKQKNNWLKDKEFSERFMKIINAIEPDYSASGLWINVWKKYGTNERRVYVSYGGKQGYQGDEWSVYFVTGNSINAPGSLKKNKLISKLSEQDLTDYKNLMKDIAAHWAEGKINVNQAIQYQP
jgi:hypothetical protein